MSSKKQRRGQKLGSSRRNRNRNPVENENDDSFLQTGNEEHESEQKDFHVVSEKQPTDASVLPQLCQAATTCISQQISASELDPQSQDLLTQAEAMSKRRKMGSTRKSNRGFKGGGIPEEEPEDRVEVSEGIREGYGVTEEVSVKGDDHQQRLSGYSSSQSIEPESSLLQRQHWALGSTIHKDVLGNDGRFNLEIAFQSKPIGLYSEPDQLQKAALSEESGSHSFNFSVATTTESKLPPHDFDDSFQMYQQMETLPNTTGQEKTGLTDRHLEEGKITTPAYYFEDGSTVSSHECSAEAEEEHTQLPSASLIKELEQGRSNAPEEGLKSSTDETERAQTGTANEGISDHCLELKNETLKLTEDLACAREFKMSEYREGKEEHRGVHMVGDRKECRDVVEARFTMQTVEPDKSMTLTPKKKEGASSNQYLSYDTDLRCDSPDNEITHHRDEQYDLSDARLLKGESSMGGNTGQTEHGVKEQNNEEAEKKDRKIRTEEEEAERGEAKLINLVRERKVIPFETLREAESDAMCISNQAYGLQHDDAGEFLSDMQSEGACNDLQAGSDQLSEIEICHDTKLYEEEVFQSNESMLDKARGNDITENRNQFFEEIKPPENICDTSALSIGQDGNNNSYAVVSDEAVELTKRKDLSAEDRMLLVYDSLDAEDKVSTEKVLTTDHLMKRAEDDELSFPQQLQRNGACIEEDFDIDLEKDYETLQGLSALAKEGDVIKNVEQTAQANVSHTYSGAHEDDTTSHLSEEQSKAVDCVEVIAATVTNSALDLRDNLHTKVECVVTADSTFSKAGENPVHPVFNKCSHITELASSYNTFDEKKENGMEGVIEEDVETETTNILQNDEILTTSFVYEGNKEIKVGNGAKPEYGVLDQENEGLDMNKKKYRAMEVAPTVILDVAEHQIDSAVLEVQNNSGEVVDAMVQKNQSQENMETEPHGQGQIKKKRKFGSTRRPQGGNRPVTHIEEKICKDVEATEEIKNDDQNIYSEETSQQAVPQTSVSEVSLGNTDLHSETETVGIIDTTPEIIEYEKSTLEDKRTDDATHSDEQKMSSIITEIPNDTSTYYNCSQEAFMAVQDPGMERTDNGSPSQVNASPTSGTMEFISQKQGSLDMLEHTESTSDFASDIIRQMSWNLGISVDHLNQPTSRESELQSTCSFILIQESKITEDDVITDHAELSTSGTKMGLIQRTEQHHEGYRKENIEDTSEKEGKRDKKDDEGSHEEKKDVPLADSSNISSRKNEVIEEENKETTEEINSAPTEKSAEEFTAVCSEQYMNPQGAELSDSKDNDGNSEENAEIRSTGPQAQNQSKKKRKTGSIRRLQGGQRPDTEGKERKWKDVEATEEFEHDMEERCSKETTCQAASVNSLTEPQIAVSEVSLGILDLTLEKEITKSKDETGLTDIFAHYVNNELSKVEELVEIIEEHPQSVEDDEKASKPTSSDKQEMPPVIMKTEKDTFICHDISQEASMVVKECDVESSENRSPSHVHASLCGTMELISEIQEGLDIPKNIENTETASDQMRQLPWDHDISKNHFDLAINRDSELERNKSTCSLVHKQESKNAQDDVITENSELNTSGKGEKMEPTQKSHRKQFHGYELDDSVQDINEKEGKCGKKDYEDMYGEEKDVHLMDRFNRPSSKNETESEETKEVINAGPVKDSNTVDFIAVCSKQYKYSESSSQVTELGLTTNIQPSPVVEYPDFKEDGENSENDVDIRNAELHTQNQSKKKRKFGSTRRSQGGHSTNNDARCSKNTMHQAATLNSVTEPQIAVSKVSLGVLDPPVEKEMTESKDETALADIVVYHIDNEVSKGEDLMEIRHPVVEYERDDESTSTDKQKMAAVITEIQIDTSTYQTSSQESSMVVEKVDVESTENGNPSQVISSPTCGTVELISKIQQSLDISLNTENTHDVASYGIKQLAWDHSIPEDHLEQQKRESEAEQFGNSSTLIHTQKPKTFQGDEITENSEPSTSGKPRKMGSTRRSHEGQFHEHDHKTPTEEISEKEEKRGYEDNEAKYVEEKDVHLTEISSLSNRKNEVIAEESKKIMEEMDASPAKDSSTVDFIAVCSEQDMHSGLSSQTTELGVTTDIQPSPSHSDSKEDDGNCEENIEVKNAELQAQSQSKKKKKSGSTQRPQGGHRQDSDGEERKWKNVESTEQTEHDEEDRCSKETTNQAASSDLLTEPQNAVSEKSLVILHPTLKKETTKSNNETGGCGMTDTSHVILTDIVVQHTDNEERKTEKLVEIIEEHGQSVEEDERDDESTSSDNLTMPPVVTEIENDVSTYHDSNQEASIIVEGHDMKSTENRSPSQVHVYATCGTVELISEVQDIKSKACEFIYEQIGQLPSEESIFKDHLDQPTNKDPELEIVESTCSLIHIEETKTTQENVLTENSELSTSGKRRKMGSTRRSHRERLHGSNLKETIVEINEKEREKGEKDNKDTYGEEKGVHLTETSNISIRKNEVVEEEREEIKDELQANPTEDSATEDFMAVCSEQYIDYGLSPQATELGLATNIQPSPVTEHSDSRDDNGNSGDNVEIKNTELHTQNQSKKKWKCGSTWRPQGGHRPDNEGEERKWKDVGSTEEIEDDEGERCSKEATNQAATSELLTEPRQGFINRPHVILTDTLLHHSDNEIHKAEELVEITEEHEKSVVEDERGDEFTSSETIPPVVTEIQNDVSTFHDFSQEAFIIVKGHDMESNENRSPSQVHVTHTCGTVELISEAQDRSHREPLCGGGLKESSEEINEKERESDEKDDEDDVHLTERSNTSSRKKDVVEDESEEIKDKLKASHTEDSTTEDFIAVCSEQYMDSGLSSQTTELGLTTNLQTSPVSEHLDSEEDDGNGEENIEVKNAELQAQSQSKKKKKFGSTRRPQRRHRRDNEKEESKWKNIEATEQTEHDDEEKCSKEATHQAASYDLLAEPQSVVSEESLGILHLTLEKEIAESKDETVGCGMTDTSHVILTDVVQHTHNEVHKGEEQVEIVEEHGQSVVEYERDDESTSTDNQKMATVITEIQNDTPTYQTSSQEASVVGKRGDVGRPENEYPRQVLSFPTCGTLELISEIQESLDIPINTENTHEVASYGIKQLPWDHSIPEDHLEQPTNRVSDTAQFVNSSTIIETQESKTTQGNIITMNSETSTSGKPRKMGSTQRSHREQLHECDLENYTEEMNETEEKRGTEGDKKKYGEEKDVHLTEISSSSSRKNYVIEEDSKETMEEIDASPAKDSSTEDFIAVCSEQYMHSGLSSQTTELGVTTDIQPSPVTEHSESKEDGGKSEENVEIKNPGLYTQNQSKKKRKCGSTRRPQGGHRQDNEGEEQKWKDMETTEEIEHDEEDRCSKETTHQTATLELLTESHSAVSEVLLGIHEPPLEKEMIESNDETGGCGIIDRPHVILTDTLLNHSDNEVRKVEELVEIKEEHEQSVVEDERGDDFTSSETILKVVTEIDNDVFTYHDSNQEASIIVKGHDMESNEKRSPSQVHVIPTCGTVELISEAQHSLRIPVNKENTHELVSQQIRQLPFVDSISKDQLDQPTNKDPELEKVKSTCSLAHIEETKTTQENVMTENLELNSSGKRRKMGSTQRSHTERFHGDNLRETIEEVNEKETETGEKDDEDTYGEEKDVHLTETSNISIRMNEAVEEESEETKDELKASPIEDSTTEDFIAVCPEQYMDSGLSPQTTELGVTTNIQPSPVSEHSDSKEDDGNSEENIDVKNAELQAQSQSKKKKKFGSTRRPQRHRRDNEKEESKWKNIEATEQTEHDDEVRSSKEANSQAASSDFLTEPQSAMSGESLGILDPTLEKEMAESKDETGECGMIDTSHVILTDIVVQHTDNEVENALELVEIVEEHRQSVVGYERDEECTFSDKQKIPPVLTEIQNSSSTYHDFSKVVEECDIESNENRSLSQVHITPTCGTVELISEVQDSLGIPVNTENTHELVSEQIGLLLSDESISKDQLDQPTHEDTELEEVESTCSLVHIEEPKTTQENVMRENLELSTSGKQRKMGSTRRSHREPLCGGGLKEPIEDKNEKERKSGEKDYEDMYGEEKGVHLTETSDKSIRKNELVEDESEEIKEELKASPTEDSITEDFIEVCSEQDMHSGLSPESTQLGLTTNIQPSPVTEHSNSKDDGGNSGDNLEMRNAGLQTQTEGKKKKKFGSTRRPQVGHRPDNEGEERKWKDVESTEGIEDHQQERCSKEATNQAATSELLTEPQSAGSEVSLGIPEPQVEKELIESNDETGEHGIIDTPHVILTGTLVHHSDKEVSKAEELVEIIEEHEQSVVEYERGDESTSSETIPPVVTETQNDASTYLDSSQEPSIVVKGLDMESTENRSPNQIHVTPTCDRVELNSEVQDILIMPVNPEDTHEIVSDQTGELPTDESIAKDQQDQPSKEDTELEKVKSTCSLVHREQSKTTQENVVTEKSELSTSGKQRKMGSTRRSHRQPLHGGLKETFEEINEKERESDENDDEGMYGEEKDSLLTETSNISIRKNEVVEDEIEEIKEELQASPTEDSTTEEFLKVCSEQDMHSGLSPQSTQLGLTTNIQPSPVTEHSNSKDDGGNSEENVEIKNTELHTQNQSKKKRKFGSTRRPQRGHRPDNEGEERKWKDVQSTEEIEDDEGERRSKEATNQAATSELLTEPQSAVSEVSLGIPEPPLEKELIESNDETGEHGIIDTPHVILTGTLVHHSDKEVSKAEELVEIIEEHEQSVVEYERGDESTSSETIPPVVTETQNDASTYLDSSQEPSIVVKGLDMESTENRSPNQIHVTPTCDRVELNSEVQDILIMPVNPEDTHEIVSDQTGELPTDESIAKDQQDQPSKEDTELEKVKSTCSLVHREQSKTTQENVVTEKSELSTSGKQRKMGSTRRSHRQPLHGGLKETFEEINEKERESDENDDEGMYGEEKDSLLTETSNISIRKNEVVEDEIEEIKEELQASPTEDSTTEEFLKVCSEQDMHSGLSPQSTQLGLTTNIQPSPVTEHSNSKDDGGNSEENVEIKNTELHTQNQSKKKRKFGSTRRPQRGHRPDNEGEERKWKDVQSTEEIEDDEGERRSKEATNQAATSELLTEPQSAVSEVSLGIPEPPLEKELIESNDETGEHGIIDTPHVILTGTLVHHSDKEVSKAEELVEIIEEHEQSVVEYERGDESTSSETIPPVVTETQNDASTYLDSSQEPSIVVKGLDMESTENRSPNQIHVTPTCDRVELNSEVQDILIMPVNPEDTHEIVSDQTGELSTDESIAKDQQDQPSKEDTELEKVKSTCSLVHREQSKTTQENVVTEKSELSTSGKQRKMGSTRRSHRQPLHGGLKETFEEINEKERESDENDDEGMYGEEKDSLLTETSNISIRKNEVVEDEIEEIKEELQASPTEDSTTEEFLKVCSEQDMHSGLSPQSTQLGLTTNIQPSPVTEHSNSKDDGGNSEENVEIKNTELHTQNQSKKKRKFGSTRRPQGGHRPDNEGEERKWKDVESTEEIEDDEGERRSKESTNQAATSELLTEPQSAVSEVSLGIPEPPLEKEMIESNDETGGCGIIDRPHVILTDTLLNHSDNEVRKVEELVEIIEEHEQSVVEDERGDESTSSDKQKISQVITEIQNDVFTYLHSSQEASIIVKGHDMESNENRSPSQVHITPACGTVELNSEVQDRLGIPVNTENAHELVSQQIGQLPSDESTSKDQLDQPTNKDPELEIVESTCSLVHIEEPKTTQENVMTENLELSSSGKQRKMGSTRRSPRERLLGGDLKETIEEINEKKKETGEKDDEDTYGEETDVHLTERSNISVRKNEAVEDKSEEIKEELKASHTEDSTTEEFIEVCSEQYMHSGLSPQRTELDLITNIQPLSVTKHSDSNEDEGNSNENVKIRNADLQTQRQSKKKRKFGSTRRPQGVQRPVTEEEERRWKDVEATEGLEHDEKEKCSEETHQAVTSNLLTESLNAVSVVSLGILIEEMKEKESSKEQTVEKSAPIAEENNSEVERLSFIPIIPTETCHQSIERQSEPSESITIIRPELEKLDKKKRKMGSTRKNFKGADGKKPWDRGTGDMDPKSDEDITKEETKSTARVDTMLDDKGFGQSITAEMIGQERELHTPHMLDQSEGSLLGEIEYELKKSCQSPLNTTAHSISEEILESSLNKPLETDDNQQNILEIPEPKDEQCKSTLELPTSQSSQTHTEPSSPGRRRKMGSTRKTPRNKHMEEPKDESRDTEQDTETQDTLGTISEIDRETAMLKIAEGEKGSVGITAKACAVPQVDENNTEHPIPGGRQKFGSRRTAKGELKVNQKETEDVQVLTDELTVDQYFIPGPESIPVSQSTSDHEDTKASPSNEQNEKSVVNEADKSTRTGLASLDDLRRSSLYNGSTGRREMIDFERWDEQIPDFGVAVYNVVMVGNCNVGKTSFIRRFQSGLFSKDYGSTIGVDTFVQTITLGNRTVKLHIWDTAGQERYHSITRQVFHKAQGLLLMYDITSSQSFYAVRNWISQIQERAPADVTMMLLGNKNDCAAREVQLKEGEDLSRDYNIHFMECSAATGENVSESMKSLAWLLVKQNVRREEEQAILQPKQPQKKSGCC